MATELGLRSTALPDAQPRALVERLTNDGYSPIAGIGDEEHASRVAAVGGPEGIVSLAQRIE